MIAPALSPHGGIGICSPSHIPEEEHFRTVLEPAIRRQGYSLYPSPCLFKTTHGYLAAPEERAQDFNCLVSQEKVELILFGGGEGSNELLPYLDFDALKRHPKRVCSYSDGTTILNTIWANTGLITYYGWSPSQFEDLRVYDYRHFLGHLVRDDMNEHLSNSPWLVQAAGKASGILVGGYCRNFAMLLNSRYFPIDLNEKHLLFLEDHKMFGGVDYVSAMLSHIEQSDFIKTVTGLLFGHYSSPVSPLLLERLRRFGKAHQIPVVYCDDFGHGVNHAILPIGRHAELDADACVLRYL